MRLILLFLTFFSFSNVTYSKNPLIGTWRECSLGGDTSFERFFEFTSDNKLTEKILIRSSGNDCKKGVVQMELKRFYKIEVGKNKFSLNHIQDSFLVLDESEAQRLSKIKFCGIENWKVGEINSCPDEVELMEDTQINKFEIFGSTLIITEPNELKVYKFNKFGKTKYFQ